ncbi:MAG: branched-chain amino acid transaminase [Methanobacteriaceae archaeon]|nr:branched-chain amino acid transaminase [Methanobacteriaceae archaeon]
MSQDEKSINEVKNSSFDENMKIWMNGELVDIQDAKINVLSHVVHYGSSVFEGIRCYETENGPAVFRLKEHMQRLIDSAKIYNMDLGYTRDELVQAVIDTIKANNLKSCYIRPISYRGFYELGVNPERCPVETTIAVWEWGSYIGEEEMENGANIGVSTWRKPAPNTFPAMAKAGANYMNSQLANMEAGAHGYDEAILLDYQGNVAEGSGENIFIVENGTIVTPNLDSVLRGITRDSIITIAKDLGYEVKEETISRERLYLADEVFFTGTAAEVTPIRSIDGRQIGIGKRGPVAKEIQETYFAAVNGQSEDKYGWLTYID